MSGTARLVIVGASGRMGRALVRLATEGDAFSVVGAVGAHEIGRDAGELAGVGPIGVAVTADIEASIGSRPEAVIDFSAPELVPQVARFAAASGAVLVSGTTGLDDASIAALDSAAKAVPVLWEPNMSVGVYVLGEVVKQAIRMLGLEYDVEIVEAHHHKKVDAPSGTALRLAECALEARSDGSKLVHGREGKPGARPKAEVGMHAIRGGDVIGDHTVHLLGASERLELTHRATSRDLFAHGALRAAARLIGRSAGRYRIADVFG
jgi:4-hydroxy-tetrahydrodipicolinate reductase